jgi:hypothetical protein
MPEIITRAEAKARGLKRYFTALPCKHGHITERATINGTCFGCKLERQQTPEGRAYNAAYRADNRESIVAQRATFSASNPDVIRSRRRTHYVKNSAAILAKQSAYNSRPEAKAARVVRRNTPKGKARERAHAMKALYGIPTFMAPHIMEMRATGSCPGCGVKFGPPGSTYGACIDHDHVTGEVRMIVCNICNTTRLRNCDDGRNPDALLVVAGRNAKSSDWRTRARALIQMRLAALLLTHYAPQSPLVAKALSIPMPTNHLNDTLACPLVGLAGVPTRKL